MRLKDIIMNSIPKGRYWSYLHTFVAVFMKTFSIVLSFALGLLMAVVPVAVSIHNNSFISLLWYFLTIPSLAVVIEFIAYHMGWDI